MNYANKIKRAAESEGLTYWEYIKKHQKQQRFGFTYTKINTAALIAHEDYLKEQRRKEKYARGDQ